MRSRQFGRNELGIRFDNRGDNAVLHLLVVPQRRIEAPFALAVFIAQFQHGAVMRVRSGDERMLDASFGLDALANALQILFIWRSSQIWSLDKKMANRPLAL